MKEQDPLMTLRLVIPTMEKLNVLKNQMRNDPPPFTHEGSQFRRSSR